MIYRFAFIACTLISLFKEEVLSQEDFAKEENNETVRKFSVVRVIQPGVFDVQSEDFQVRMRAWGVRFPKQAESGYEQAITFTQSKLLNGSFHVNVKTPFDSQNLKVVDLFLDERDESFSQLAIEEGIGWHDEEETGRFGPFVMAQIKSKRRNLGVWKDGNPIDLRTRNQQLPLPLLQSMIGRDPFSASLNYWVTTFGKIHRPGCSFYERGRGEHSRRPVGEDCRLCGGAARKSN